MKTKLRSLSWLFGLASIGLPAIYLVLQVRDFEQWAKVQGGPVCGMPLLGIWFASLVSSGLLSTVALSLNGASLRSVPRPRPASRYLELAVLAAPLAACVAIVALAALA
jgi:hypothetical protein